MKQLLPLVEEAVGNLRKEYGFTQLISIFMKRRIQPRAVFFFIPNPDIHIISQRPAVTEQEIHPADEYILDVMRVQSPKYGVNIHALEDTSFSTLRHKLTAVAMRRGLTLNDENGTRP